MMQEHVELAPLTTIRLGGPARWFARCTTAAAIKAVIRTARDQKLPLYVLGGGSNTIFPDRGWSGVVLQVALRGIELAEDSPGRLAVSAGEPWDDIVQLAVTRGWAGIECLSGIPGSVGATPMQNVGAYGQEVADVLEMVHAIDTATGEDVSFTRDECGLGYRTSRFKKDETRRYLITQVVYQLQPGGAPVLRYPEVAAAIGDTLDHADSVADQLAIVRRAVLQLRRRKSMILDAADPHAVSCGSFFMNPILSSAQWEKFQLLPEAAAIPAYPARDGSVKLSAAALIERAGFAKGQRHEGVGISQHHILALVNYGGTTAQLLELAAMIQRGVQDRFNILLEREPVVAA